MDVRCENCGTEYELDDTKLKPSGVTVKCTHCGHTFKVRKRTTQMGISVNAVRAHARLSPPNAPTVPLPDEDSRTTTPMAVAKAQRSAPETARQPREESGPVSRGRPSPELRSPAQPSPIPQAFDPSQSGPVVMSGPGSKERLWLIRLPDGQIETCRELITLQQWIISGKVYRSSGISRTGKTWKPLGEIAELESFFQIAEEAQQVRRSGGQARVSPPGPGYGQTPGPGHEEPEAFSDKGFDTSMATRPLPGALQSMQGVPVQARGPGQSGPTAVAPSESGGWSGNLQGVEQSGPSGPTGGFAHHQSLENDVAFGGSQVGDPGPGGQPAPNFGPGVFDDEDEELVPAKSSAARWAVLLSLFLLIGAATVGYFTVFRDTEGDPLVLHANIDGGIAEAVARDAGTVIQPDTPLSPDTPLGEAEILALVNGHILADDANLLKADANTLAELEGASSTPGVLFARARIHTAQAQHLLDQVAAMADAESDNAGDPRALDRQARQHLNNALTLVKQARKKEPTEPIGYIIMADMARMQKKRKKEVEKYLGKVLASEPGNRDALLIRALTHIRDNQTKKARTLLEELASGAGDLSKAGDARPLYRLAMLDVADKSYDDGRRRASVITTARPGHPGAEALIARIDRATSVDTSDPLPIEEGGEGGEGGENGTSGAGGNSYDALITRANRKAENGDCTGAIDLFERALDLQPASVDALTGMGYCYIDLRQFASAHNKFKTALAVSPRNQEALWGIAEAYQQQGLAQKAIASYQKFIDVHPNSPRAARARQQIDKLGGSTTPDPGGEPGGEPGGDSGENGSGAQPGAGQGSGDAPSGGDSSGGDTPSEGSAPSGDSDGDKDTPASGDSPGAGDSPGSGEGAEPSPAGAGDTPAAGSEASE